MTRPFGQIIIPKSSFELRPAHNKGDCCTTVEKASLAMTVDIFVDNSDLRLKI